MHFFAYFSMISYTEGNTMATIYRRDNSPYWWIKYRNEQGKLVQESTHLRVDDAVQIRQAKRMLIEKKLVEMKSPRMSGSDVFEHWVLSFLDRRYHGSTKSFDRQRACWENVEEYFKTINIISPRQVTYDLCVDYVRWRKGKAARNTAIAEVKCLGMVMGEAVRRGFITENPCRKLGLKRDKPKEKPELTEDQITKIREELKNERWPDWMSVCFEMAIHQGCRLRETSVPFSDIDLDRGTITFDAKRANRFTTALHPDLKPLLHDLKKIGSTHTCKLPPLPSKWFRALFDHLGMREVCFHCTRVTVITRLARAGVPMSQAMRFVGHASETIHRIYQRLSVDDLSACVKALSANPSPQSQGAPSSTPKPAQIQ
jgi:integrase